jgi:anti-sigma factor RsiW
MDPQHGNELPPAPDCRAFRAGLDAYFLGLQGERSAAVEPHAATCPACREFLSIARELSCRDFAAFLDEYLDERLSAARRAVFDRHLALCDDCVRYLQSYEAATRLACSAFRDPDGQVAPAVPPALIAAILAAR